MRWNSLNWRHSDDCWMHASSFDAVSFARASQPELRPAPAAGPSCEALGTADVRCAHPQRKTAMNAVKATIVGLDAAPCTSKVSRAEEFIHFSDIAMGHTMPGNHRNRTRFI